ncbi:ML domain-containing protein [Streptomyces sp. BI20]|uniref:ML domain-containing protein n=1 Tax=Streptomyces sp. BI20 TaxID=3403460 RepID=UPI003C71EBC3
MPTWNTEGSGDPDLAVSDLTFAPETPVKGKDLTLTVTGTLKRAITSGTLNTKMKYGIVTVLAESVPLGHTGTGPFTAQQVIHLPEDAPSGSYTAHVTVLDDNGSELAALYADLRL